MLVEPKKAIAETLQIGIAGTEQSRLSPPQSKDRSAELALLKLNADGTKFPTPLRPTEIREPSNREPCLAVRANGDLNDLKYLHYSFDSHEIGDDWSVENFNGDRSVWHGAPVFSEADGKMIGVLILDASKTRIAIISPKVFE